MLCLASAENKKSTPTEVFPATRDTLFIMPKKVLIIDDHPLTHSGLKLLFQDNELYEIAGNLMSGKEALPFLDNTLVDIVLLDLNLTDTTGISLLAQLAERDTLSIIIITGENRPHDFAYALQMGVDGIISKSDPLDAILTAVEKAGQGNAFLSAIVKEQIGTLKAPKVQLSPRQMAVLYLIDQGETNKEIGYRLSIAPNTVTFHINEIRKKLDITSNQQILNRARELDLL